MKGLVGCVGLALMLGATCAAALPESGHSYVQEYAHAERLNLNSLVDGVWTREGALDVWRLRLQRAGAVSLSVHFERLSLPLGATLTVSGAAGPQWPYTQLDVARSGALWSAMVPGETLTLTIRAPAGTRSAVNARLGHLYVGFEAPKAKAQSGACEVSTACTESSDWSDAARSVAMITIEGTRLCTATLLNNVRTDGDPLLLTARHCFVDGAAQLSAESVVAYWTYALDDCSSSNLRSRFSQSGAELLDLEIATDAALLRLSKRPPAAADVRYAGWDAAGALTPTGATIHHPQGDDRKLSRHTVIPAATTSDVGGLPVESLRVYWSQGVTEPGSSGAALFNAAERVVGQLSGGRSECDVRVGPDYFGRLELAFGSSPGPGLWQFLDPDATGTRSLDGIDASNLGVAPESLLVDQPPTAGGDVLGTPAGESQFDNTDPQRQAPGPEEQPAAGSGSGGTPVALLVVLGALALRRRQVGGVCG